MIKSDYNISSEALRRVVEQYYHPSYESVIHTQEILDKIEASMIITDKDDGSCEVEFKDWSPLFIK